MKSPNILKKMLQDLGIKSMVPTEDLLEELGMTLIRFNKILENTTPREVTALEAHALVKWLARLTNQSTTAISLWGKEAEVPTC
jgi:hypothetical protein